MADQNQQEDPRVDYYCHQCRVQFHTPAAVAACTHCGDGFIEQIPRPDAFDFASPHYRNAPFGVLFNGAHAAHAYAQAYGPGFAASTSDQNQQRQRQGNGNQQQQQQQQAPRQDNPGVNPQAPPQQQPGQAGFEGLIGRIVDLIAGQARAAGVIPEPGQPQPDPQQNQAGGFPGQPQPQPGAEGNQNDNNQPSHQPYALPADFVQQLVNQLGPNIEVRVGNGIPPEHPGDGAGDQPDAGEDSPNNAGRRRRRRPRHEIFIQINGDQIEMGDDILNALAMRGGGRLSDADIERLPMTTVPAGVDKQCTTCMDNLKEGAEVGKLNCGHMFHRGCIVPWLQGHNTCPVCRARIDPSSWVHQQLQQNDVDLD